MNQNKKEKVRAGENYYWLSSLLEVCNSIEMNNSTGDAKYQCGNYFRTKDEAEKMAKKISAVFAVADVIVIPSEDERINASHFYNNGTLPNDFDYRIGFMDGSEWLTEKII